MRALEDFFRKPEKSNVSISPDGDTIAYMAPFEKRMNVYVQNMVIREEIRITSEAERDILFYIWGSNDRIIYARDKGGDENVKLFAVGKNGEDQIDLTPYEGVQSGLIDELVDNKDEILIRMNKRDPQIFDAYRLNIHTGKLDMIVENPGNYAGWVTDHDGKLRCVTTTDGVNTGILYRQNEDEPFQLSAQYNFKESSTPLLYTFDNKNIYVASNVGRDKSGIFIFDLESGKTTELIFEHSEVDVQRLVFSKKMKCLLAVMVEGDKPRYHFLDDNFEKIYEYINQELPGQFNPIIANNKEENKFIIYSSSDNNPGSYYYFDLENMQLELLFDTRPWFKTEDLVSMKPIRYKSRDMMNQRMIPTF